MANDFILNGLKLATSKGDTLQEAMLSFFNAGYPKQEIEESARVLQIEQAQNQNEPESFPKKFSDEVPMQSVNEIKEKKSVQSVSSYGQESSKKNLLFIIRIALLIVALGLLAILFLFRTEIIDFIKNF